MRLFTAVWLDKELRETIRNFLEGISNGSSGIKWVFSEQLHFTLKFLGEQDSEIISKISPFLSEAAKEFSPFTLALAGGGVFPSRRSPRVLWLGVKEGGAKLAGLAARVEEAGEKAALPREKRAFRPHLTIGRVKNSSPFFDGELLTKGIEGRMTVKSFSLVASSLTHHGPVYQEVEEYFFK